MGVARLTTTQVSPPRYGQVQKKAMVIGSGLSGLNAALALADKDIPVTIIGQEEHTVESNPYEQDRTRLLTYDRIQAARNHPRITLLENARLTSIHGHPGDYEVIVEHEAQTTTVSTGAIIVANGSTPKTAGKRSLVRPVAGQNPN